MRAIALHLTNCLTFGRRLLESFLSHYARTNFPTFPRNYGRMMQPILQTLVLFQKSVCPIIPPYCLLASELTVSNKAE